MCGIAGIFTYAGDPNPGISREVTLIRDHMAARGPDGAGLWTSPDTRVAFGHRRLAIIDLRAEGAQPMVDRFGGHTIVFNGEIYNYLELKSELTSKGYVFRSESDTEVLLAMYAECGSGMCDRLRGMYTFAIHDAKSGDLFLGRDPYGIKPLYFADDGKTFRFASQVKALVAGGAVGTKPDSASLVGYHLWGSIPEPRTIFRDIRALPPGSTLRIDSRGNHHRSEFCSIQAVLRDAHNHPAGSRTDVRTHLLDTVRHHLIADVPVAVFLSAGIDSQVIAKLVAESGHADLRTLTVGFHEFTGTPQDEVPLAEAGARKLGANHTTRFVTREDFQDDMAPFLSAMDQPTIDAFNTWCVSKVAAACGMKVCLSGLGGDELFSGYGTFRDIPRINRLARTAAPFPLMGKAFRWLSAGWIGKFTSPKYAGLFELGRSTEGAWLLHRGLFMPWELPGLLPAEILRDGWAELDPMVRMAETTAGLKTDTLRIAALEMCWYMRNQLLRDSDWAGMAHSLEIRVPLVDIQLLRNLAPMLAGPQPPVKSDVATLCGLAELAKRPKTGFSTPVRSWFSSPDGTAAPARGLRDWSRFALRAAIGQDLRP